MIIPGVLARHEPAGPGIPLLFDLPHSGRAYPADFNPAPPELILRRAEDAYVDDLLAGVEDRGVTLLKALFPRAYIDPNRAEDDIDPDLLAEPWPGPVNPGPKSAMGIGLVRRLIVPGAPVHDRKLTVAEVRGRIDGYWRPYRAALSETLAGLRARHGRAWHIQWHSMKAEGNAATPDGPGARRPDFVLGDLHGAANDGRLTAVAAAALRALGHSVAINDPYAGADLLRACADPAGGVHSLQIEINKRLYMDEDRIEKTAAFAGLSRALTGPVLDALVAGLG